MAEWQSGHAAACKAVYSGSIPLSASIYYYIIQYVTHYISDISSIEIVGCNESFGIAVRPEISIRAVDAGEVTPGCAKVIQRLSAVKAGHDLHSANRYLNSDACSSLFAGGDLNSTFYSKRGSHSGNAVNTVLHLLCVYPM